MKRRGERKRKVVHNPYWLPADVWTTVIATTLHYNLWPGYDHETVAASVDQFILLWTRMRRVCVWWRVQSHRQLKSLPWALMRPFALQCNSTELLQHFPGVEHMSWMPVAHEHNGTACVGNVLNYVTKQTNLQALQYHYGALKDYNNFSISFEHMTQLRALWVVGHKHAGGWGSHVRRDLPLPPSLQELRMDNQCCSQIQHMTDAVAQCTTLRSLTLTGEALHLHPVYLTLPTLTNLDLRGDIEQWVTPVLPGLSQLTNLTTLRTIYVQNGPPDDMRAALVHSSMVLYAPRLFDKGKHFDLSWHPQVTGPPHLSSFPLL